MRNNELHIIYGATDIVGMAHELMEKMNATDGLDKNARIALKPNFVVPQPAASGATTHAEIAEGIILYLRERGFKNISLMESSWAGLTETKSAFRVCGFEKIAEKYNVPFYDLKKDAVVERTIGDLTLKICKKPLEETDFLINLPVLKAHCQTKMTCSLKNLKGCIPDAEKRRFHRLHLLKPIAYLAKAIKIHLTVVDALCGDLTFEEGGHPVRTDRLIGGIDPVLTDSYGASLLGFLAADTGYLPIAEKIGVGSTNIAAAIIREHREEAKTQNVFKPSSAAERLAANVNADAACSVCYGSLMHALQRLRDDGVRPNKKICIGQGFRNRAENGIGIGNCTEKFAVSLKGCPPSAKDMAAFLSRHI